MFEAFRDVWGFITSRDYHWSSKLSAGGLILTAIVFCELGTGLVSGFINSQRIDQLTRIESAILTPGYDNQSIIYLKNARKELISRGTIRSYSFASLHNALIEMLTDNASPKYFKLLGFFIRADWYWVLHVIFSSGFWIFAVLSIISNAFFSKTLRFAYFSRILFILSMALLFSLAMVRLPIMNYGVRLVVDLLVQIFSILLFSVFMKHRQRKNKQRNQARPTS